MQMEKWEIIKKAISDKYAWPGGYPMYLLMNDGEALCMDCGAKEINNIEDSTLTAKDDGWNVSNVDVNWEDANLYCAHCGNDIPSAYGDDAERDTK